MALRELPTGLILGAVLGVIGLVRVVVWQKFGIYDYGEHWMLVGLTVAAALIGVVTFGSVVGSMLPFIMQRRRLRSGGRFRAVRGDVGRCHRADDLLQRRAADPARDAAVGGRMQLEWRHERPRDSHYRHRSRPAPHRLGHYRERRQQSRHVACGSVEPPDDLPLAERLLAIHRGLAAVMAEYAPMEAAVEQTFVNKDGVATLKLGQARGVAMLAPALLGISVAEYAPNQVKKTVVGAGHADKAQIQMMLRILLPKAAPKTADAADALASRSRTRIIAGAPL